MIAKRKVDHQAELMAVLPFDEEDLAANQDGYMSKHQRRMLRVNCLIWQGVTLLIVGILGMAIFNVLKKRAIYDTYQGTDNTYSIIALLCFAAIVGFILVWLQWRRYNADLQKGIVFLAESRIFLNVIETRNFPRYTISLDGAKFYINKSLFLAFKNNDPYRIYYAPSSKVILSAEALREE